MHRAASSIGWPTKHCQISARAAPANYEHFASPAFWNAYEKLSPAVRELADKNYTLLKSDPRHPSLRLKKVGRYWSVRVGLRYRALAIEVEGGLLWFWIGSHADYDAMVG